MTETLSSKKTKPGSVNRSLTDELADSHISNTNDAAAVEGGDAVAPEDSNTAMTTADSEKDATTTVSEDGCTLNTAQQTVDNSSNSSHIPCSLEKRDNYYILPKCELPPRKRFAPVEKFVANAVQSKLELEGDSNSQKAYNAVMDAIRRKRDLAMLEQIFLALRTAGNGSTLHQLSGNPTKHAQLLHFLLRFDPFSSQHVDKHGGQVIPDDANGQQKDDPASAYSLADAYFHLILALVSANSVFLVPTMVRAVLYLF